MISSFEDDYKHYKSEKKSKEKIDKFYEKLDKIKQNLKFPSTLYTVDQCRRLVKYLYEVVVTTTNEDN